MIPYSGDIDFVGWTSVVIGKLILMHAAAVWAAFIYCRLEPKERELEQLQTSCGACVALYFRYVSGLFAGVFFRLPAFINILAAYVRLAS
jgi:hypothetical protein